jgi:hypothetical protein
VDRHELGMSMVELTVALTIFALVLAMVVPIVETLDPVTAFAPGTLTADSMTFYSDIRQPGAFTGPTKVAVTCAPTAAPPPGTPALCTLAVALTAPAAGTCPTSTVSALVCTYATAPTHRLAALPDVTLTPSKPLFVYSYSTASGSKAVAATTVSSTFAWTACVSRPATCPLALVDQVAYDIVVQRVTTAAGAQGTPSENAVGIFTLSTTSTRYSPLVG